MTKYVELVIVADNREVRVSETSQHNWFQKEVQEVLNQLGLTFPQTMGTSIKIALFQSGEAQTI